MYDSFAVDQLRYSAPIILERSPPLFRKPEHCVRLSCDELLLHLHARALADAGELAGGDPAKDGGGGDGLTIEEPENNIVRGAYYALASALSGTQTMALCCYDEAYTIPSEKASLIRAEYLDLVLPYVEQVDIVLIRRSYQTSAWALGVVALRLLVIMTVLIVDSKPSQRTHAQQW
jgi:hypothetical protein